jgi:predicted PurR-regulated permease PerM
VAAWEILAAMLTGEALFGVQGLVAAPLLYPFFKLEIKRLRRSDQSDAQRSVSIP